MVRKGGIYIDVPPQYSTRNARHAQSYVATDTVVSLIKNDIICNKINIPLFLVNTVYVAPAIVMRNMKYLPIFHGSRAAFRILLKGGGGQNSCFRIPGGQALHAVQYNIYIVKF